MPRLFKSAKIGRNFAVERKFSRIYYNIQRTERFIGNILQGKGSSSARRENQGTGEKDYGKNQTENDT